MFRLAIGDKLLIKQTSIIPVLPWQYRIVYLPTNTTVASATGITDYYKLIDLTSAVFGNYEGKTLLLEILDNGVSLEDDMLLLSGPYGKYTELKLLAGILGENAKHESALDADYQDGHETHKTITLYNEGALSTELASYDWEQAFVTDFTPDARYQVQQIKQARET